MKNALLKPSLVITVAMAGSIVLAACSDRTSSANAGQSTSAPTVVSSATTQAATSGPGVYGKYVDDVGNIALPDNITTEWAHLGSWAVAKDGGVEGIHNVYAPKEDVEYFRKNQSFRDGAMMVKEVRAATGAAHTTGNAHWGTDIQVWFLMVKDTQGRFENNALWGDGWGWALYNGDDRNTQVASDYKKDCLGCHIPAKETDWTYVYAYPTLGPEVAQYAPGTEEAASMAVAAMSTMAETTGDTMAGEQIYARCAACHSLTAGQHGLGPSLAGIFGRKAGSAEGYNYSPAMTNSDVVWTEETLDAHLADVPGFIPGNKMAALFRNGVQDPEERAAVIAYMKEATK